jgi:hypothetical protein
MACAKTCAIDRLGRQLRHPQSRGRGAYSVTDGVIELMRQILGGRDRTFSFDEALRDALKNLPPDPNPNIDMLSTISVTDFGVELGGIIGFHRLCKGADV